MDLAFKSSNRGFGLLELLVGLGVIITLSVLVTQGIAISMAKARKTRALNQLRSIGHAVGIYIAENNQQLPGSQHERNSWVGGLLPYFDSVPNESVSDKMRRVYKSPGDPHRKRAFSYAINDFLLPHPSGARHLNFSRMPSIPNPSQTILFTESQASYAGTDHFHFARYGFTPELVRAAVAVDRYNEGNVYLFVDCHVEWIPWSEMRASLQRRGSRLIHPSGHP